MTPHFLLPALYAGQGAEPGGAGAALLFAGLTAASLLVGAWAVRSFERWTLRHIPELIAFAAGLLIAGALLHLSVRAVELLGTGPGFAWTLVGFLVLFIVEAHFIPHVHVRGDPLIQETGHAHTAHSHAGPMVVAGLAVHSVADGLSVGVALSAGSVIGSVTMLLVVAHRLPVGIAAMSALYHSGVEGDRAFGITAALATVTPIALLISYFVLRSVSNNLLGILLALTGGSFLYIGAADLLPEGQATGRPILTVVFFLGCSVMIALKALLP